MQYVGNEDKVTVTASNGGPTTDPLVGHSDPASVFTATYGGSMSWVRVRVEGDTIRVKLWGESGPEPDEWFIDVTSTKVSETCALGTSPRFIGFKPYKLRDRRSSFGWARRRAVAPPAARRAARPAAATAPPPPTLPPSPPPTAAGAALSLAPPSPPIPSCGFPGNLVPNCGFTGGLADWTVDKTDTALSAEDVYTLPRATASVRTTRRMRPAGACYGVTTRRPGERSLSLRAWRRRHQDTSKCFAVTRVPPTRTASSSATAACGTKVDYRHRRLHRLPHQAAGLQHSLGVLLERPGVGPRRKCTGDV